MDRENPVSTSVASLPYARWLGCLSALAIAGCAAPSDAEPVGEAASAVQIYALPQPAGYWRFDDCSAGKSTILDTSGRGHDGTKSGNVTCTPGFSRAGGAFDGATGMVQIPDSPDFHFTNAVTIAAWVNPSATSGQHTILDKWYGMDSYMLSVENGQFRFYVTFPNGGWGQWYTVSAPAKANTWTHVAGVFNGSTITLYVDGAQVAQAPAAGTLQPSNQPVCIGNCPSWNAFAGKIDEVWLSGQALDSNQIQRLAYGVWPNVQSSANSDPWIVQHHDQLAEMHPKVLALDFVNYGNIPAGRTTQDMIAKAQQVEDGLAAGSRYHGYTNPAAPAFITYDLVKAVDLTDDGAPPVGWNHLNSSKYPLKCSSTSGYQFDYSALFSQAYAAYYGYVDPRNPARYLTLGELVQSGMVNEVWLYVDGDPDAYRCDNGVKMTDFQLPEVLELKQVYDAAGNPVAGQFDPCAGNGCIDASDVPAFQATGRSLRILYINSTRGSGCAMHSLGHGFESTARAGGPLPYLAQSFQHFANFDLSTRPGVPFSSWYACSTSNCITYTSNNALTWSASAQSGTISPYDQGCGSVHFPPNARGHYDDQNPYAVYSTCEHYGLHDGPGGADLPALYTDAKSQMYDAVAPDCQGGWQVYWRQSFPGLDNPAIGADHAPMKSWWPYLFY